MTTTLLITGASSGIGRAVARRMARPGMALALHARAGTPDARARLDDIAAIASKAGATTLAITGDLAEAGTGAMLVDRTLQAFGRLDGIVACAGFADRRQFGEADGEALDASYRAMTRAFFEIVTRALPALEAAPHGRVLAISSFVAHKFAKDALFPVSAAAKAGLEALARTLAVQLAQSGTTVNVIAPGYTRKDDPAKAAIAAEAWRRAEQAIPMGRLAEPGDIAAAAAFLLGEEAGLITGQVLHVDGGLTLG